MQSRKPVLTGRSTSYRLTQLFSLAYIASSYHARCWTVVTAGCWPHLHSPFVGCSGRDGPPKFEGPPVRVVCTTTIVADVVQRVGGDRVQVETLMGPGVDPHKYISGAGDRKKLDDAHLVFFNGLHLEGKMADTFEKNQRRWRAVRGHRRHRSRRSSVTPTWTAASTTRTSGST